jgi:hypothetical protein
MAKSSYDDFGSETLAKSSEVPLAKSPDEPSLELSFEPSRAAAAERLQAVDEWNVLAGEIGLSRVAKLTSTRQSKLTARLHDCGGIEGWRAALVKIRETPGLQGQNDRGWRATFDWLTGETAFTRLMEDYYARWGTAPANGAGRAGHSSCKRDAYDAVFAGLAAAAGRKGAV